MAQPSGHWGPGEHLSPGSTASASSPTLQPSGSTGDPDISTEGRAVLKQSGSLPHFGFGLQPAGSRFGSQSTGTNQNTSSQGRTATGLTAFGGGGFSVGGGAPGGVSISGMHQGMGLRLAMPDDDDGHSACHSTMAGHHGAQPDSRPENSLQDGSGLRVSIGGTVYLGGELIVTASGATIRGVPASSLKPQDFVEDGRILGKGISGMVRCMIHRATGERIAVKEIGLGKSDIAMQNVKRELRTLFLAKQRGTGLTGPQAVRRGAAYVVDFFGAWANQGSVFIAMECMDGSLGDFPGVPCPEAVAARITAQVVRGLKFLHEEAFLVHRDLKPPNILFSRAGIAKITDFGLTSQLSDGGEGRSSSFVGSVMYMSPERLRGETYSLSSDVWALGLTIAEVALGFHPFRPAVAGGQGQQETFWKLLEIFADGCAPAHRLVREAAQAAGLSPAFTDFVIQCIQADETHRPACSDLLLHHWLTVASGATATPAQGGLQTFNPIGVGPSPGLDTVDAAEDDDYRGFSSDDDDDEDATPAWGMGSRTLQPVSGQTDDNNSPGADSLATAALAADPSFGAWLCEVKAASASARAPGFAMPEQS